LELLSTRAYGCYGRKAGEISCVVFMGAAKIWISVRSRNWSNAFFVRRQSSVSRSTRGTATNPGDRRANSRANGMSLDPYCAGIANSLSLALCRPRLFLRQPLRIQLQPRRQPLRKLLRRFQRDAPQRRASEFPNHDLRSFLRVDLALAQ
jgi:hypothetical protein